MSLYLDTSTLAKLVVLEDESSHLRTWLADRRGSTLVTNSIGAVELHRLAARVSQQASEAAVLLLARIDLLSLTPRALDTAARLPPAEVRTLDALHLASAAELADLEAVVTYDRRMLTAAADNGLPVASPGA